MAGPVQYRCVSDSYDPDGRIPYASVGEFLEMCRDCFGEAPSLHEVGDGLWHDADGLVLEPFE